MNKKQRAIAAYSLLILFWIVSMTISSGFLGFLFALGCLAIAPLGLWVGISIGKWIERGK